MLKVKLSPSDATSQSDKHEARIHALQHDYPLYPVQVLSDVRRSAYALVVDDA